MRPRRSSASLLSTSFTMFMSLTVSIFSTGLECKLHSAFAAPASPNRADLTTGVCTSYCGFRWPHSTEALSCCRLPVSELAGSFKTRNCLTVISNPLAGQYSGHIDQSIRVLWSISSARSKLVIASSQPEQPWQVEYRRCSLCHRVVLNFGWGHVSLIKASIPFSLAVLHNASCAGVTRRRA